MCEKTLGTLIRCARSQAQLSLDEVAKTIGVSPVQLDWVERDLIPLGTDGLQGISALTGCSYEKLVAASQRFNDELWKEPSFQSVGEGIVANLRTLYQKPPEQVLAEYREGWISGATGRDDPADMGPDWTRGFNDGKEAFSAAITAQRMELKLG